jgi:hypothetical protein
MRNYHSKKRDTSNQINCGKGMNLRKVCTCVQPIPKEGEYVGEVLRFSHKGDMLYAIFTPEDDNGNKYSTAVMAIDMPYKPSSVTDSFFKVFAGAEYENDFVGQKARIYIDIIEGKDGSDKYIVTDIESLEPLEANEEEGGDDDEFDNDEFDNDEFDIED